MPVIGYKAQVLTPSNRDGQVIDLDLPPGDNQFNPQHLVGDVINLSFP
jgi:hypothetical protein